MSRRPNPGKKPPKPVPPPPSGAIATGDALRAAIAAARPGDTLTLQAGAVLTGPFTLPKKDGDGWITLQSSAWASLPWAPAHVTPADAPRFPRLVSPGGVPAIRTEPGAHHWRLLGLEVTPAAATTVVDTLITLGDGGPAQNSLDAVPHHLILDRCYIHGWPDAPLKRGVGLQGAATDLVGCWISECKVVGQDSQAVCGWNGPGPFRITNCYLEGAGENVMFGGADPHIPNLVPSDIEIRGCTLTKPLAWRGRWAVKNLFELKNARRVVINGNLFENNWVDGQAGFAILMKSVNQEGSAPWCVTEDVTFTNNIVRHSAGGVNLLGTDGTTDHTRRIRIENNLFEDIDGPAWGGEGWLWQMNGCEAVTFTRNTAHQTGLVLYLSGANPGLVVERNLLPANEYGVKGDGTGSGTATLDTYAPGAVFTGNVIVGAPAALYPAGNAYPATWEETGAYPGAGCDVALLPKEGVL